jgi:hypothetical protein
LTSRDLGHIATTLNKGAKKADKLRGSARSFFIF